MEHVDVTTILNGLEGRLTGEQRKALKSHLANCQECSETFSEYASLLDALSQPVLHDAPASAIENVLGLFQPKETKTRSLAGVVRTLLQDSWSSDAVFGLRGELDVRQVGMSTDNYDLHLSIDYAGANIRGQLLPRLGQGFIPEFQARLVSQTGNELDTIFANEFGEFVLANTGSASQLELVLNDGKILQFEVPDGNQK